MDKKYTFDNDCFSDLFKDVNGFRPRNHEFFDPETTDDQKQEMWDSLYAESLLLIEDRKQEREIAVNKFNALIKKMKSHGAKDFKNALEWIFDANDCKRRDYFAISDFIYEWDLGSTSLGCRIMKTMCKK